MISSAKNNRKNVILKTLLKDKTLVKLQALLPKRRCTADPEVSGCFLIQIMLL